MEIKNHKLNGDMKMKHEINRDAAASRETTVKTVVKPRAAAEAAAEEAAAAAPAAAASVSVSFYIHFNFIFKTTVNFEVVVDAILSWGPP